MEGADLAALLVSLLALLFTVLSFWWMNWRNGKLHVWPPRSFAAKGSDTDKLVIQLPLVLFNDGPTPIVVRNLRLVLTDAGSDKPLSFQATVQELASDTARQWATAFPVRGREMLQIICQFQRLPGGLLFEPRIYPARLEARLGDWGDWKVVCDFEIRISPSFLPQINRSFLAFDNEVEETT